MRRRLLSTLCLFALATPAWSQTAPAAELDAVPEKILVVGQRPGPGLWKVTKDDHVLWIFGTYSPLPDKMAWRSRQVETVLAQSQELIGLPWAGVQVSWSKTLNMLTALPFLIGVKKNADGARLQDLVAPDVYARWTTLKAKYIGADAGIETDRPIFAADELFRKALQQSGLGSDRAVVSTIHGIAKEKGIKFTPIAVSVEIDNPRGAVRDFKKGPLDDIDCFTKTIERLEVDIDAMRGRANAWATGDVETMRTLTYPDQEQACKSAFIDGTWVRSLPGASSLHQRQRDKWLAAAEKSLASNQSTFAMLPVAQIMNPTGLVAALAAKGYRVEQPE
ncbi:MAG: TraB/GumN family protein [Massilia sp.]|nr:TraB/GumN family protein [Massilia sp.]